MSYSKIYAACRETSPRYPASLKTWGSSITFSLCLLLFFTSCMTKKISSSKTDLHAKFTTSIRCSATNNGYNIFVQDQSTIPNDNQNIRYTWYINGKNFVLRNKLLEGESHGKCDTITLQLTDTETKINYYHTEIVCLPELPQAKFTIAKTTDPLFTNEHPSICEGQALHIQNLSTGAAPINAFWDFGDCTSNNVWNPTKVYDYSALNNMSVWPMITVIVTDAYGCTDSAFKMIDVLDNNFEFSPLGLDVIVDTSNKIDLQFKVSALACNSLTNPPIEYTWFANNKIIQDKSPNNNLLVPFTKQMDTLYVRLTDARGCFLDVMPPESYKLYQKSINAKKNKKQ